MNHWNNRTALIAIAVAFFFGLLAALSLRSTEVDGRTSANVATQAVIKWRTPVAFGTNLQHWAIMYCAYLNGCALQLQAGFNWKYMNRGRWYQHLA